MTPFENYNELLAQKTIDALKKRNMNGYYCKKPEEALALIDSMIKAGEKVGQGGSMTLEAINIPDMLRSRKDITFLDRTVAKSPEESAEISRQALLTDTFLMSSNAITEDGQLVNIDGNGNRLAALIFGPKKVIIVAGLNKIAPSMDAAMLRARTYAAPLNTMRLNRDTPCVKTGDCHNCFSPDSICNQFVITRRSRESDRIHVILLDGTWGY